MAISFLFEWKVNNLGGSKANLNTFIIAYTPGSPHKKIYGGDGGKCKVYCRSNIADHNVGLMANNAFTRNPENLNINSLNLNISELSINNSTIQSNLSSEVIKSIINNSINPCKSKQNK